VKRSIFALRVRAEPNVDVIRSLRAWLKLGLRTFGLRCVSIEEVKQKESNMVDMRKYASGPIMPDDLRDGPRQGRIINVYISEKHDVPVLVFESGDELFAWPSIARVLTRRLTRPRKPSSSRQSRRATATAIAVNRSAPIRPS